MRVKKCKWCGNKFTPKYRTTEMVCSVLCAVNYGRKETAKKARKEKKEKLEGLMTQSAWAKKTQVAFNAFIRERDKNKLCISCGTDLRTQKKFDAGHLFTVGAHPELRFNEDNCHGQCVECNRHKHGNQAEYTLNLPARIGRDRFNKLLEAKDQTLKYSINKLKELEKDYKAKTKELKKLFG